MATKTHLAHYANTALYVLELHALLGYESVRLADLGQALGLSVYRVQGLLSAMIHNDNLLGWRVQKMGRVWIVSLKRFVAPDSLNRDLAIAHLLMLRGK